MTGFWKTVPNHTFLFQYIYHCHMKNIAFSIIFHSTTWNSMLKLLKPCKKYSVNTYTQVEISLNTCRNTLDFMCDLELFSKIRSHIMMTLCPGLRHQVSRSLMFLMMNPAHKKLSQYFLITTSNISEFYKLN